MTTTEGERPFYPPKPRPNTEIWQAAYKLSRRDFLEAVEYVVPFVAHLIEGMPWEYEGFRHGRLYIRQPGSHERELLPVHIEFGMQIKDGIVTVYVNSSDDTDLQLFRRLTTELDDLEYVAKARVTPCTHIGQQPPIYSPDWA